VSKGASKRSVAIAFGGGSVGNLVGLAAALLFRGIRYVEVPTSFMHMTDGVLSNKQAINGRTGKNHFGVYHAPLFIWADVRYLETVVQLLTDAHKRELVPLSAVYVPGRHRLPKVSVFLDFLAERFGSAPWRQ
jgi:3-dehydroquinate synthetase